MVMGRAAARNAEIIKRRGIQREISALRTIANGPRQQASSCTSTIGPAHNLADFLPTLALPEAVSHWSITTLRDRWGKVGAKIGGSGAGLSDVVAQRQGRSTEQNYHTLDQPALCRLPIGELAAKDAGLAMWVYGPPIHWR